MKGFLGSGVLEAAISASFVYLVMSVFCSRCNEWIATLLNARANTLAATIRELLKRQDNAEGTEFLSAFYAHPIVTAMMEDCRHPSYLPSRSFVTVVLDLVTPGIQGPISFEGLEKSLAELPRGSVRTSLLALTQNTERDLGRVETNIANWFDDAMSRASGSYKRRTAVWTAIVASALTMVLNADTIALLRGTHLSGWDAAALHVTVWAWLSRIAGWSLTVAAVSQGAPFWFDVLNRFVNPRGARLRPAPPASDAA